MTTTAEIGNIRKDLLGQIGVYKKRIALIVCISRIKKRINRLYFQRLLLVWIGAIKKECY